LQEQNILGFEPQQLKSTQIQILKPFHKKISK